MKRKFLSTTFLAAIILAATSCKTVSKSHTADYDYLYITKQGILQKPLITDLEVGKQRSSVTKTYNDVSLSEAKENAVSEFMKQQSCDLVVQPYFNTSSVTINEKTNITVTLSGYAAVYKNIRNYEAKDAVLFPKGFPAGSGSSTNKLTKPVTPGTPEKKNDGGFLSGMLLGRLLGH